MSGAVSLQKGDALVIVDVQNDFLPGGALAVPQGDEVVPVLNDYIALFERRGLPIFATRDWHPADHCSFRSQGGPWPEHCIRFSHGAEFAPGLKLPRRAVVISKPSRRDQETYTPFEGINIADTLRKAGIGRLLIGGLATDYCVLHTVLGARQNDFEVLLLRDAVRAVNVEPGDGCRAQRAMEEAGALPVTLDEIVANAGPGALLTDFYELTMLQGYFLNGMDQEAVFELFVRHLPANRHFLVAAGLEQALGFLEELRFEPDELKWLGHTGKFGPEFLHWLAQLRFTGSVEAMPEGTVFFAEEPILRITAPLPEAQLVETRLLNLLQFQTLIASKAVRCVLAAPGKGLVDFGLRRAHGAEAGCLAARASYLAGFDATSNVLASRLFGIPLSGTMAHSFIQAHPFETEAFRRFAHANPHNIVLLLDTYNTESAAHEVVELAQGLRPEGLKIQGVRLDSGDLAGHAFAVREILDEGGCGDIQIFASGNLDELALQQFVAAGAPIDGFGIGSRLDTSADAPYLDCVYKIQEYAGRPVRKRSEGKATWPGRKQVYRFRDRAGRMERDLVAGEGEPCAGEALLAPVMRGGRRMAPAPALDEIRQRVRSQLAQLPGSLRRLEPARRYPVEISASVRNLAKALDRRHESETGRRVEHAGRA